MALSRSRTLPSSADTRGRPSSSPFSPSLAADSLRAISRLPTRLLSPAMRSIWSWYPASSPRCSLVSKVSRRTVALRSCNCSCSRRSRRVSRLREPTSPRNALIVSFRLRARSSALRSWALALRGGEDFAARFNLPRSAATFLRSAAISSFCFCERSSALLSRAFSRVSWRTSRVREATSPRSAPAVSLPDFGAGTALGSLICPPDAAATASFPVCNDCKASRSWKTSMRSEMIVLRLLDSTPACESSFSSRPTSAWKNSASFAARRTSFTSSAAALSLSRLLSRFHFSEPARERASRSARRSSSQRASAASARARSISARACACSHRDCQSRGSDAGTASGGDQNPPSASVSVGSLQNPRRASPCARRYRIAGGVTSVLLRMSKMTSAPREEDAMTGIRNEPSRKRTSGCDPSARTGSERSIVEPDTPITA